MNTIAAPAEVERVPADAPVHRTQTVSLRGGGRIVVRSLQVKGLLSILAALEQVGFKSVPAANPADFLTAGLRENLSEEDRQALKEMADRRLQGMVHWVLASRTLLPAVLEAVVDRQGMGDHFAIDELEVVDVLKILTTAVCLLDVKATIEAALAFFSQIGGLMAELGNQATRAIPTDEA